MPYFLLLYYNQPVDSRFVVQKENPQNLKKGKSHEPALPPLPEHSFFQKKKEKKEINIFQRDKRCKERILCVFLSTALMNMGILYTINPEKTTNQRDMF